MDQFISWCVAQGPLGIVVLIESFTILTLWREHLKMLTRMERIAAEAQEGMERIASSIIIRGLRREAGKDETERRSRHEDP